jgi:dipeptidyl aminopeptidase/acylaminoacyl peptidase
MPTDTRSALLTFLGSAVLFGFASIGGATEPRAMTAVDLISLPRIQEARLSPDGSQVLYVLSSADWKANKRVSHIWRIGVDGTGNTQMTTGKDGEDSPRWSPDGRTIAFVAKRGDAEADQIYVLAAMGGEARQLTSHATAVSRIAWAPDGSALYFTAADPKTAEEKAREKVKDDVYSFDEDFEQVHLWRATLPEGKETRLTEGGFSVGGYAVSRDGSRIAHHRAPSPLYGDGGRAEVWVMNADGSGAARLTTNEVTEQGAEPSPDGSRVLFTSDANARFEPYYNDNLFVVPAAGGAPRELAPELGYEISEPAWSKDGRSVYFLANMGLREELFALDADGGRPRQLTDGLHTVRGWSYDDAADRHVFLLDTPTSPGEVFVMPAAGGPPVQVTHVFDSLERDFRLPRQEKVTWKGKDGATVEGLVYYPLDYDPARRWPLVVQTHGGPASSDQYGFGSWASYVQVLTAKGYAVLKPNYRGSTGYGDAFLRDMVGGYFRNAHLDVMAGVDALIQKGMADPERLVKMGWSAGGHMTNKIITFTDRFRAAASGAGAANWISMYAQSDVRTYRTPWFGGTPWQARAPIDVYWEQSPLKYVANVKTPTLFLVGEKDPRVPMPQSVEMHRALKANGVPTKLYVAPREPHGWRELRHQLFKVNVELDWFETHAMKRAYTWEKAPEAEKEKR